MMRDSGPASLAWPFPPPTLTLEPNEAHVWLVEANDAVVRASHLETLLSSAERERAAKFKFEKDRRLYTVTHAALRSILAGYLNVAPGDLEFEIGRRGKPRLAPNFSKDSLEFNLSHSFEVALIAVTREREIGVDVEHIKKEFAFAEVAERYFTTREVSAIRALPEDLQRRAFYQCWTSKEAFLKAKGVGLSGELDEVEILFGGEGGAPRANPWHLPVGPGGGILSQSPGPRPGLESKDLVQVKNTLPGWHLSELNPCDGYVGAIALEINKCDLRCYRWPRPAQETSHSHP
ncbi:MAG: 4'-phosphopantetheinyl transferase superfamily protein [Deltaproteobacteria bacterium]|nr:4'-phosphopantetheinyl transferase superfamily protein [Deltaproteobacteria bacterium]